MSEQPLPQTSPAEPADLVETLWEQSGQGPDLNSLLADHPQWSVREVRDALLIDQQFRWRTGDPWITEDYLTLAPSLAADDDLTLDLIYGECRGRTQQGNPPDLAELVQRFPHLRERLERQMEIASWFAHTNVSEARADEEDSSSEAEGTAIRFGDYELCEEIARGGMGVIYRAQHRKLKRTVALKMIRPERLMRAADVRRFKNETRIIARLEHPNIIPILNVGQVDGVHFFTMRMVRGRDLESRRAEYLGDVRRAARLLWAVAAAIHHAHQHGVLHRDLKPSNVLVDDSGMPYVVDFGLARHVSEASGLTGSDEFLGTPAYAAPEQLREDSEPLTVAADIYGLGAILYVLITGQPPFSGRNSFEIWSQVRESEPQRPRTLNGRVDPDLEAICLKALEKNPAARYPSAAALADDLERYLAREPVAARPVGWWQRRWRWLRKHPARAAIGLAGSAAALGLLTVIALQSLQLRKEIKENQAAHAEAHAQQRRAREALYVADIRLADAARQAGDSMQLAQLLERQVPAPGENDVRGFEWFVLDRTGRVPCTRLQTAFEPVGCVAYSPDGRRIAAAGAGGRIQVFPAQTQAEEISWPTEHGQVRDLAFSPDGSCLASAGDDGAVMLHPLGEAAAASTGRPTSGVSFQLATSLSAASWKLTPRRHLRIAPSPVWQVDFLADGKTLATYAEDAVIRFVRCEDGIEQGRIESPDEKINALALAPDGTWLVTGGEDGGIGIWDVATRRRLHRFQKDNPKQIKAVALSGDGKRLATGGTDKQVQIWDISDHASPRLLLRGDHYDRIQDLAFSADARTLAACDKNGSLRLWPVPAAGEAAVEGPPARIWQAHEGRANSIAFHPAKNELASAGQESHVAIWDLAAGAGPRTMDEPGGPDAHARTLAFTPDSRCLAVPGQPGVRLWNVQTEKLERTLGSTASPADHVAISPDGHQVAVAHHTTATLELWELPTIPAAARSARVSDPAETADRRSAGKQATSGQPSGSVARPATAPTPPAPVTEPRWKVTDQPCDRLVFSPDRALVAAVSYDGDEVVTYDTATGRRCDRIPAEQCRAAAFSPDGRRLAFTVQDSVVIWDWPQRRKARELTGHISTVTSIAFSPDGRALATAGNDRRIKLWDPASGQLLHTMTGNTGYVRDIAFVDNGRLISVDDLGYVHVWHTRLGQLLCTLRSAPHNSAHCMSVSPDRRHLALRLDNGQVELLDISRP